MMCHETYCLSAPEFNPVFEHGVFQLRVGYQGSIPFAAILIDKRDGMHLHIPAGDITPMLSGALQRRINA